MNEEYFEIKRRNLINGLRLKGIFDDNVLDVMLKVPRHLFVEKSIWVDPYEDAPQSIGEGQTISQPYIVALMTMFLNLSGEERVLEIGTGCGYQTAILCELAKEVFSVERIESLSVKSRENLEKLGYSNFDIKLGDGTLGWEEHSPYDAIIVTAASPEVPDPLKNQLAVGGRMIIPVGKGTPQELISVIRTDSGFKERDLCGVYFVPLIGKFGWND